MTPVDIKKIDLEAQKRRKKSTFADIGEVPEKIPEFERPLDVEAKKRREELPEFEPELGEAPEVLPPRWEPPKPTVEDLIGKIYADYQPLTLQFIEEWATTDPEAFLSDLVKFRGRTPDTEKMLELFGASPELIEEIFTPVVPPEPLKIPEGGYKFTQEVEGIERLFTISEDYLVKLEDTIIGKYDPERGGMVSWGTQQTVVPVDGIRKLITITPDNRAYDDKNKFLGTYNSVTQEIDKVKTIDKASEVWDALIFGSRQMWELGENFFLSALPNLVFQDTPAHQRAVYGDEFSDRADAISQSVRDKFRSAYAGNKAEFEEWVEKNPNLEPRLDYAEGATEHPELLTDPWYWGYEFANIAPFCAAVVVSSITAGALTGGNPLAMITGGASVVYPVETQAVMEALLANGANEQQAAKIAGPAGIIIASLESLGRLPLLRAISPQLMRLFRKEAAGELGKLTARELFKKGIKTATATELSEVITEVLQEATQNAAVKIVNENQSIFENLDVIAAKTAVATAPLSLFGGGVSMRRVAPSETQGFTDLELQQKGFVKEPQSDTWFQQLEVTRRGVKPVEPKPEVKYLYHGTTQGALRKILSEGIKPTAMGQVSLADTELEARSFADRKGGTRGIILRVRDRGQFVPDERIIEKGDFLIRGIVKPEDIEVKMPDGSWAPLIEVEAPIGVPELKAKPPVVTPEQYITKRTEGMTLEEVEKLRSDLAIEKPKQITLERQYGEGFVDKAIIQFDKRIAELRGEPLVPEKVTPEVVLEAELSRYPKEIRDLVQSIKHAEGAGEVTVDSAGNIFLDFGDPKNFDSQLAHEIAHIRYRSKEVEARFETFMMGKLPPFKDRGELYAQAFEEFVTGKPTILPEGGRGAAFRETHSKAVDEAIEFIKSEELSIREPLAPPVAEVKPPAKAEVAPELTVKERFDRIDVLAKRQKLLQAQVNNLIEESKGFKGVARDNVNKEITVLQDELVSLAAEITELKTPAKPPVEVKPASEVEAVKEVEAIEEKTRRQLTGLGKMYQEWWSKLKTAEETKTSLAKYVRENLPLNVRGKYISAVARVKTDAQLQTQMARVQEFAELNAQKTLKAEVRKEIKKTQAKVKDHILKGKFTPETQRRLDTLNHNLELDRDTAREKMADNIQKYDDGKLSYEEMLEANESLNFAGIEGMSTEELAHTLEYIKELRDFGRSERQAKQDVATERIKSTRTDIGNILTGGQGLKTGVGAIPRGELATQPSWVDTFVNWQYSLDNLADKLSKLDPTSQPYQSELSKFVAAAHRATARQAIDTTESFNKVKEIVKEAYGVKTSREVNAILNGLGEEVNLGVFELTEEYKANHPDATTVEIKMTRDQMIAKYMQMQDPTLNNTFTTGMGWSQKTRDAVEDNLTTEEKKLADAMFGFYEEYYVPTNEIYQELYNVDMPHNPKYSPIRRDFEGDITENVLTFQDAQQYASVLNGSLKARQRNTRPLKFNGAIATLSNHIIQMEHFKAWATTMRDFRRVFGNKETRQAIEQYHGRGIVKLIDTFMNQMARGGIETAATNRVADFLRKNFTKSILAIKPVVGLKQIPSLFAYVSEMNVSEFFGGVVNYWKSPIKNFKFLYANSEGYRARISQGFERDIRAATAKHGVNRISGRGGFVDWFLLQIRLGDTFAVTQGMWAKYQAGLKAGLTQEEALAAAEDTTNRTQPSFGIDTLSSIQNGGSWLKLMTMFQNQPNKYFRLVGDNARNFKYGRGSRVKAASNILLAWVVLPMLFQFIADAFQWKPERQARAGILGPLNFILIAGQLVQSMWGWLTDGPFDYQISPVAQTGKDLQNIFMKARKLVNQGLDPYKDISTDDVAALIEYLAKAGGQVLGLPTPYFVQLEKQLRKKIQEGEDIDIKDFLFSTWALEPPKKDAEGKVEEAGLKLGETEEGQEDRPATKEPLKIYDTKDWFREIGEAYKNVLPQDVLDDKEASVESKAWAELEIARSQANILPNVPFYEINTEDNADTIIELYRIWKGREGITSLAKLKEYDSLYEKAGVPITHGNVTRQQYNLLVKYLEAEDKDAFLKEHEGLLTNPRNEWLKNPENARGAALLALAGEAKILSIEAYNEFNRLIDELDVPDDAIPDGYRFQDLDKSSVEDYFEFQAVLDLPGMAWNSWESQIIWGQDDALREFLDYDPIETPVRSLELKIRHRPLFDERDSFSDKESSAYIEDDKAREEAIKKLKADNPEWVDDMRRIEAIENAASDETIESWVKRGNVIDQFSAGSSEAMVWLLDNPEVHKWALEKELLTDDGSDWNVPVLRTNVKWRESDDKYLGYGDETSEFYIADETARIAARDKLLLDDDYRMDRRRREAFGGGFPEDQIENFVDYWELPVTGYRQERLLIAHPELATAMGIDLPERVPSEKYDTLLEKEDRTPQDELRMDAYKLYVDDKHVEDYVAYYSLEKPDGLKEKTGSDLWYEDDWWMMEHQSFYKDVYLSIRENQRKDYRTVPTREVFDKYLQYLELSLGDTRSRFRLENLKLDAWLVEKFGYTSILDREKLPEEVEEEPEDILEENLRELEEKLKRLTK